MHPKSPQNGFSLIEMAVVMLIMGSLLSGLLVALTQTSDNTRRTTAKSQLIKIEEALYAFARAHGRLPCPATSTSNGYEDDCSQTHGFVPAASLSLYGRINNDGLLLDPWANPYRYSVAPYEVDSSGGWVTGTTPTPDPDNFAFTNSARLQAMFGNPNMNTQLGFNDGDNSSMLRVCPEINGTDCEPADGAYTLIAPAVVFSMGNNWTDLLDSDCSTPAPEKANEAENAGGAWVAGYCMSSTNTFVDTEYHEENFDDILVWLSPYILFSRMIDAAQLP